MPGISQPSDRDFESTLASLAHARLRDKAPALLDWLLGFQVIDQNEEQTHGIGILGFQVGDQLLYVPVFFLNGELKMDLLYLKDQDLLVPLEDDWITYLLNRRPFKFGEGQRKSMQELGVMDPDMSGMSASTSGSRVSTYGLNKANSAVAWARSGFSMFTTSPKDKRYDRLIGLPEFLKKEASYRPSVRLASVMRKDNALGNAVLKFYDLPDLLTPVPARKSAAPIQPGYYPPVPKVRTAPTAPRKAPWSKLDAMKKTRDKVSIQERKDVSLRGLEPKAASQLLKRGYVVQDDREETNKAYEVGLNVQVQNPDGSGWYSMLCTSGEERDVFLTREVLPIGEGRVRGTMVLDKDGNVGIWPNTELWTSKGAPEEADFQKWFDGLSDASSIRPGSTYVLVSADKQCSVPFLAVNRVEGGADGSTTLWVSPLVYDILHRTYGCSSLGSPPTPVDMCGRDSDVSANGPGCTRTYPSYKSTPEDSSREMTALKEDYQECCRIVLTDSTGSALVVVGTALFAPTTCKVIKVNADSRKNPKWEGPPPGSLSDMIEHIMKSAEVQPLELRRSGSALYVNGSGPHPERKVLFGLIKNSGLREDDARQLLGSLPDRSARCVLIKNAIGYAPPIPDPNTSYDSDLGALVQYPQEQYSPADMPQEDEFAPPDRSMMMNAAATGQKDIFDSASIGALVKAVNSDDLVNQYISDLLLGLDRIGRILLMFYWHNEKFRDRYGRDEMANLEDQLRNVFSGLGELVLFLKQRGLKDNQFGDALDVELGRPE